MGVKSFTTKIFWNLGCALLGMLLELSSMNFLWAESVSLNLNLNSLLVKRQIDNPSPGAVTGGN